MSFSESCYRIFEQATEAYHTTDNINATVHNPYPVNSFEFYLYLKHWVDAVQWHLLNIIHQPDQEAGKVLEVVSRIEKMNQERVDLVELIDSLLQDRYKGVKPLPQATLNTESPAWAIDRLSILALKIYHMQQEVERTDATPEHIAKCQAKLNVLLEQNVDLPTAIGQLLDDIEAGKKYMKVYRQMKMYNDADTNPILYGKK